MLNYLTKFLEREHSLLEWCHLDEFWMERDFFEESQVGDTLKFLIILDEIRDADCDFWYPECQYVKSIPYSSPFDFKQLQLAGKIFLGKDYTPIDFQSFYEIRKAVKSFNSHNKFVVRKNLKNFRDFKRVGSSKNPKPNNKARLSDPEELRNIFGSLCLAFNRYHNDDMTFFNFLFSNVNDSLLNGNETMIYVVSSFLSRFGIQKRCYDVNGLPHDYIPAIELEIRRILKLSAIA